MTAFVRRYSQRIAACTVADCDRPQCARGLCRFHYQRMRLHGTIEAPPGRTWPSLLERFTNKYWACPMSGCWLWVGATYESGYGSIGNGRREDGSSNNQPAHRVSYELFVGPIPDGLCVLHRCDVPSCVNPAHLFLGTHADNAADKVRKGRAQRLKGEASGCAKITTEDVVQIRALYAAGNTSGSQLAARFALSDSQIYNIIRREAWGHIE